MALDCLPCAVRESGRGSRTVTRTFSTKAAAQAFERKLLDARELGAHARGPASRDRLEDWLEAWFSSNRATWARSTVIARASVIDKWIVPYIGGVRLSELGPQRLRNGAMPSSPTARRRPTPRT